MKKILYVFSVMGLFAQSESDAMRVHPIGPRRQTLQAQANMDGNVDRGTLVLPRVEQIESNNSRNAKKMSVTKLVVPNTVIIIHPLSFSIYERLTEVEFEPGSQLAVIEIAAFYKAGIREITIPRSVERLGRGCFMNCSNLKQVIFEQDSKLAVVEAFAFSNTGIRT